MRTTFKKRSLILMLAILMTVSFFSMNSETQAAPNWYLSNVVQAGPGWGYGMFVLTAVNGTFTGQYMTALATQANAQLATALTAISLGKQVWVYVDPAVAAPYAIVQAMWLNN